MRASLLYRNPSFFCQSKSNNPSFFKELTMVFRVYVEKKPGFDVAAQQLANELRTILGIEALKNVRLVNRYDVEGISEELFAQATPTPCSRWSICPASSISVRIPPASASS